VGGRTKLHALRLEVTPQCTEVIDFAIKADYVPAAARLHRLGGPGIEVKDGEAPMSEDHALPLPGALIVGTATAHTLQGTAQRSTIQHLLAFPKCRDEAAHQRLRHRWCTRCADSVPRNCWQLRIR